MAPLLRNSAAFCLLTVLLVACSGSGSNIEQDILPEFATHQVVDQAGNAMEIDRPTCAATGMQNQFAVCEGAERQIVVFDSSGREEWRFGRRGEGPGEFHTISGMWFDSAGNLHVVDGGRRKAVLISPDGKLIADRAVPEMTGWVPRGLGEVDGKIVVIQATYARPSVDDKEGLQRTSSPVMIIDTSSGNASVIDTVYLSETFIDGVGFERFTTGLPFGATGDALVAAGKLIRGFARDSFVVVTDLTRLSRDTVFFRMPAYPTSMDDWDKRWQKKMDGTLPDFRLRLEKLTGKVPRSPVLPRYIRMFTTPTGTVALYTQAEEGSADYRIRCVLRVDGDVCPEVLTTPGEVVIAVASGRAVIVQETADGTYHIQLKVISGPGK